MFGETTISYVKIGNHPIETTIYKWLFGVPGLCYYKLRDLINLGCCYVPETGRLTNPLFQPCQPWLICFISDWGYLQDVTCEVVQKDAGKDEFGWMDGPKKWHSWMDSAIGIPTPLKLVLLVATVAGWLDDKHSKGKGRWLAALMSCFTKIKCTRFPFGGGKPCWSVGFFPSCFIVIKQQRTNCHPHSSVAEYSNLKISLRCFHEARISQSSGYMQCPTAGRRFVFSNH